MKNLQPALSNHLKFPCLIRSSLFFVGKQNNVISDVDQISLYIIGHIMSHPNLPNLPSSPGCRWHRPSRRIFADDSLRSTKELAVPRCPMTGTCQWFNCPGGNHGISWYIDVYVYIYIQLDYMRIYCIYIYIHAHIYYVITTEETMISLQNIYVPNCFGLPADVPALRWRRIRASYFSCSTTDRFRA